MDSTWLLSPISSACRRRFSKSPLEAKRPILNKKMEAKKATNKLLLDINNGFCRVYTARVETFKIFGKIFG
jgi:hypothetical protein